MNPALKVPVEGTAKFRRKESVAGRRIAGESFLIPVCGTPVDLNNIFVMNPLAEFIFQCLRIHTVG